MGAIHDVIDHDRDLTRLNLEGPIFLSKITTISRVVIPTFFVRVRTTQPQYSTTI